MRTTKFLLVIVALGISGCTTLNVGRGHYSCLGIPEKVGCMSAREVYMITDE